MTGPTGNEYRTLAQLTTHHPNGLEVAVLTTQPLESANLDPTRVAETLSFSRKGYDFIIVDMHPSYGPINRAIFERADRILVPITPDVPALRAGVQLSGLANELGVRDKLAMVVNRANSGVSVADMERTVGMPAMALIRSGGLLFVRAANEGHAVVEQFPREKVTEDFDALADRLLGIDAGTPAESSSTQGSVIPSVRPGQGSGPSLIGRAAPARSVTRRLGPRQPLVRLARPPIDLVDPAQIAPVDQERVHFGAGDRVVAEIGHGVGDRHEHLRGPVEQPFRLGSGEQVDRSDRPGTAAPRGPRRS